MKYLFDTLLGFSWFNKIDSDIISEFVNNVFLICEPLPGMYSGVPNKRAACLFVFEKIFHPTCPY